MSIKKAKKVLKVLVLMLLVFSMGVVHAKIVVENGEIVGGGSIILGENDEMFWHDAVTGETTQIDNSTSGDGITVEGVDLSGQNIPLDRIPIEEFEIYQPAIAEKKYDFKVYCNEKLLNEDKFNIVKANDILTLKVNSEKDLKNISYMLHSLDSDGNIDITVKTIFTPVLNSETGEYEINLEKLNTNYKYIGLNIGVDYEENQSVAKLYKFELTEEITNDTSEEEIIVTPDNKIPVDDTIEVEGEFNLYLKDEMIKPNGKTVGPIEEIESSSNSFEILGVSIVSVEQNSSVKIKYEPAEAFIGFEYRMSAMKNPDGSMPKVAFPLYELEVENDGEIEFNLPDIKGIRISLTLTGILKDGTRMSKTYRFHLTSKEVEEGIAEGELKIWLDISEWAEDEVNEAKANKLVPKVLHGKDYTQGITRSEFAAIVVSLYEKLSEEVVKVVEKNPFIDTDDENVLKAYSLNITNGVSENEFAPDKLITREQMATMMTRAVQELGIETTVHLDEKQKFEDNAEISDWAQKSVYFMNEKGIIKGMENNVFKAKQTATREQAILISNRCFENL